MNSYDWYPKLKEIFPKDISVLGLTEKHKLFWYSVEMCE